MMPLSFMSMGEGGIVRMVKGKTEAKQFLENLGFVPGCPITVVAKNGGNVIVSIKQSRVAISREMALNIMV